jgi:hypothetical protein
MLRQWNQNKKINTSFLQLKNEIKQWCCNRRSKDSEMVSRKVFPSGFRPVSDPFGGAHGLCPLSGNPQGELKNNTSLFALREVWQNRGCRSPSSNICLKTCFPKRPFRKSNAPRWITRTEAYSL